LSGNAGERGAGGARRDPTALADLFCFSFPAARQAMAAAWTVDEALAGTLGDAQVREMDGGLSQRQAT
jgi:hypothetical protein